MSESLTRASGKIGLPPGSLVHVGAVSKEQSCITIVDYTTETFEQRRVPSFEDVLAYKNTDSITWVNFEGLHDITPIEQIGKHFGVHLLVLEDILNTHQRPKFEDYGGYLFFVLKGLSLEHDGFTVQHEQISILLLHNYVFTFKEKIDDIFTPLALRLKNSKGRIRSQGADYLAYVLLDTIVDQYFTLEDSMDDVIESLEDELLLKPTTSTLAKLQTFKRELVFLRKSIMPLREMLVAIQRNESPLIEDKTQVYFRDLYDHVIRVTETIETYRELISGMLDIYLSSVSNKMNEVMKVLTVFATIFIPLTFIVGIYGMNFEFMPELKWHWAYPALWGVFIIVPTLLLYYFKKKKWL